MFCAHCGGAISAVDWATLGPRTFAGPWRHGAMLIARKDTIFPARCLKTNLPTTLFVRTKLTWTHPAFWLAILLCVCWPLFIVAMILIGVLATRRVVLHLPVLDEVLAKQRRTILKCMIAVAASFIFFPLGRLMDNELPFFAGFLMLFAVGLVAQIYVPLISVQRIDRNYVYINGVCPEFLAELPDF